MNISEILYWKIHAVFNKFCRYLLFRTLPGIELEIKRYKKKSNVTGTKYTSLWLLVRNILKYKPKTILESGTGLSTIIIAETLKKISDKDLNFNANVISMESNHYWYTVAKKNLPKKYNKYVNIIYGKRKKIEFIFYRGYYHSNIPKLDYDFIFIDGPSYNDRYGSSFCADLLIALNYSRRQLIRGVIDTRVSTVFVLQQIFKSFPIKYYSILRTTSFKVKKQNLFRNLTSRDFSNDIWGRLKLSDEIIDR